MVLLSDKHPIDLTIGQELPPTFHYAWVILDSQVSPWLISQMLRRWKALCKCLSRGAETAPGLRTRKVAEARQTAFVLFAAAFPQSLLEPLTVSAYNHPQTASKIHLIIDSSGLSIVGEGEWATAKHGRRGRRGWKKLHLGVDQTGVIVAHALTEATLDDATTGVELIVAVNDDITRVTGDAAYDTVAFYDTASARGATVVVPPAKTARVSPRGPRSRVRDRTINTVKKIGRCRWKKTSRYQQQARVEHAVFRDKSMIGEGLRAKTPGGRTADTLLACNILNLNTMTDMGRSNSYAMGR